MFGIGFSEIVLIALVLIIFIKPEDMPALLRKAGRTYGKVKKTIDELMEFKNAFMKQVEEVAKLEDAKAAEPEKAKLEAPKPQAASANPTAKAMEEGPEAVAGAEDAVIKAKDGEEGVKPGASSPEARDKTATE